MRHFVRMFATGALLAFNSLAHAQSPAKPLARTQFIAEMDAEFRRMDADKNGQVTAAEIDQYQRLQAVVQAQARNLVLFGQLDADKDGQLSKIEFSKLAAPATVVGAQPMLSRMDGNRDRQVSLVEHRIATLANFDRIDTDRDGVASPAEMAAAGVSPR